MKDPNKVENNELYTTHQKSEWARVREMLRAHADQSISPLTVAGMFMQLQDEGYPSQQLSGMAHLCARLALQIPQARHTPSSESGCQSCGCNRLPVEGREPHEWTPEEEDLLALVEQLLGPIADKQAPMPDPMIYGDPILEEFRLDSLITWIYGHLKSNGEPTLAIRYWHYAKSLPYFPQDWEPLDNGATAEDVPL